MANRVTQAEVKQFILVSATMDFEPQIDLAHLLVDEALLDKGFSAARLKAIETYLAAHFVVLRQNGAMLQEIRIDDTIDRYFDHYGEGLKSTIHGQMAITLDTSGTLGAQASAAEESSRPALFSHINSNSYRA